MHRSLATDPAELPCRAPSAIWGGGAKCEYSRIPKRRSGRSGKAETEGHVEVPAGSYRYPGSIWGDSN
jgi:hypothetical protein